MRPLPQQIKLEESQRQVLEQWVRAHSTPQQVVKRCQFILQSAEGKSDKAIGRQLGNQSTHLSALERTLC
jgi:exonuclease VII small subunit